MYRQLLLICVALIAVLITACAPTVNLRNEGNLKDSGLLTDDPCAAPCWNGITPGETKFVDARVVIEDDVRYQKVDVKTDEETQERAIQFSDGEAEICCQIYSSTGETVDSMQFLLAPEMTLKQIIDKFGDPTYVQGAPISDDQAIMYVVYPDVSMAFYVFVAGAEKGELSDSSEIVGAVFLSASEMQYLVDGSNLYAWEGYQSYADYIDEKYDHVGVNVGTEEDAESETESD